MTSSRRPQKVCVLVPTTAQPVPIVELSAFPNLELSTVVSPDWVEDTEVTRVYRQMLQPHGCIGRLVPEVAKQRFVLVLGDRIDTGRSWQLPVLCAHLLAAAGATLTPEPDGADVVVWATGAIAMNVAVAPDAVPIETHDYALARKFAVTGDVLRRVVAKGGRAVALLPPDSGPPPEAEELHVRQVSRLGEVVPILATILAPIPAAATGETDAPAAGKRRVPRRPPLLIACGAALAGLVAMDPFAGRESVEPPTPGALPVLRRLMPPPGRTCLNLLLGDAAAVELPWPDGGAQAAEERGRHGTCGIAIDDPDGWTVDAVSGFGDLEKTRRVTRGRVVVLFGGQAPREPRRVVVTLVDAAGRRRDVDVHVPGWRP